MKGNVFLEMNVNYPPQHHQEANYTNCIALAKAFPLATVITHHNGSIHTSHLPLVFQENENLGYFVGHIDRYNPQLKALSAGSETHLIFHGPETYISPAVYHSTQLPTWNYFKSHFSGVPTLIENPENIKKSLIQMTSVLEGKAPQYELTVDNTRMEAALPYIVGFEITIQKWEGKHKISQDKHPKDQAEAKKALEKKYPQQKTIIDQLYEHHQVKKN